MMRALICFILLISVALCAEEFPKREICLMGCKLIKKDWQRQLCELACDQIKADSELFMKELKQLGKAAMKKAKALGVPLSDAELSNGSKLEATTGLNVRNGPCTSNAAITTISAGTQVTYLGETKSGCGYEWRKVSGSFGQGWAASNYLKEVSGGSTPAANGAVACAIEFAKSKVGGCYSQQHRDGNPCYDCSSLMYYSYKHCGVNIAATWTGAYPGNTRQVSFSEMRPGDILWRDGHVAMFIGNGRIVQASSPSRGICNDPYHAGSFTRVYRAA